MNMKFILLPLCLLSITVQPTLAAEENITIKIGEEIQIESPDYPNAPPTGTNIVWNINTDPNIKLLLNCEDVRISDSSNCKNGYLMVYDGANEEKFCGNEPGLTIRSVSNIMRLEFDLNWASGLIKCQIKGIKDNRENNINGLNELIIELEPNGKIYDRINLHDAADNLSIKWRFVTKPASRISFYCSELQLDPCELNREQLTIGEDLNKLRICDTQYSKVIAISELNTLKVELNTGRRSGLTVDCMAHAITGDEPFQYRNIESHEIDSSEYGQKSGIRKTNCNCGWSAKSHSRIVNGQEVSDGQYPWMASLNYGGRHICGGSIITEYHIITAAHCTRNKEARQFKVYLGTTNNTHAKNGQIIEVNKIFDNNFDYEYYKNDIAIMLLKEKINFTATIGPACLTSEKLSLNHKYVTVMGWGSLGESAGWKYPEKLMRAYVRVVDINTCSYLWYHRFNTSEPDRLCTWASNRDSCMGDSGGPVVWLDTEINRYTLLGLVSMGRGCNTDSPKVNAYVPYHYFWIENIIKETVPEMNICTKI